MSGKVQFFTFSKILKTNEKVCLDGKVNGGLYEYYENIESTCYRVWNDLGRGGVSEARSEEF